MAQRQEGYNFPMRAASVIGQYVPVRFTGDPQTTPGSALTESVVRAGSQNEDVLGMSQATCAVGDPVSVCWQGETKAFAGASLGAGARLIVGSTNGILIPFLATGAAASGANRTYTVGRALRNGVAGDIISILLNPEQIT